MQTLSKVRIAVFSSLLLGPLSCQRADKAASTSSVDTAVPAAPSVAPPPAADTTTATDPVSTLVYVCPDSFSFTVRAGQDSAWLHLQNRTFSLTHVASASGAKYSDSRTTFWSKGDNASLEHEGRARTDCVSSPSRAAWEKARLRGIDFRALGQEPGWLLEIDEGNRIHLLADYGERQVITPAPPPEVNAATGEKTYRVQTEAHQLVIVTRIQSCTDVMSGDRFPSSVVITLDGREYRGCGRVL